MKKDEQSNQLREKIKELEEIRETLVMTLNFIDRVKEKNKQEKS